MRKVLFAWELGRGLGHLITIRRIAARLKAHGIRMAAVVGDLTSIAVLGGLCSDVIQAPPWPLASQSAAQRAAQSSATLNDILSSAGLADPSAVRGLLLAWEEIFNRFEPDLVIAEFAPMAALAARGRIPLMLVGNGYTLPPDDMRRFPPLHRVSPPRWNEEATLTAVNRAMESLGKNRLQYLPQLFSGDARIVQTFGLLDPYDTQRLTPADGPMTDHVPAARSDNADAIFVYLSGGYDPPPNLVEALCPFGARVHVHAPRLSTGQTRDLVHAGAQINTEPAPLRDLLSSSRLVVHTGGSGLASEALLAGVPQLIVSRQIEQTLNGGALERAGVSKLIEAYDQSARISSELIAALCEDAALAAKAAELGLWHRRYLSDKNPERQCELACLTLLGMT